MRTITKIEQKPTLPKLIPVAAYARVSSGKDAMLHSLSAQVSYYSEYIQNNPEWDYVGVYSDEAKTGTKDNREGLQKLLADCRSGKIKFIVTKSISRFARNTVDLLEIIRELKNIGIGVFFEEQRINTLNSDGELLLTILASYAQEESRNVSENCKWRIKQKFENGEMYGFTVMYGYDIRGGIITINEEQAAVIRRIFSLYIGGWGMTKIAKLLNDEGIPTYSGSRWNAARVGNLLGNEKVTGNALLQKTFYTDHIIKKQLRNNGERDSYFVVGTHPAIIETAVFDEAQRIRLQRAEHAKCSDVSKNRYPFSGKIVCGHCGKHYKRRTSGGKIYWQCSTFLHDGKNACPAKQIPEYILTSFAEQYPDWQYIHLPAPGELMFILPDGTEKSVTWQYRSRRESWTDEMRKTASERELRRKALS